MKRYERVVKTRGRSRRKSFLWPVLFVAVAGVCLAWALFHAFGGGGLTGWLPQSSSRPASSAPQSGEKGGGYASSSAPSSAAPKDVSITILGAGDDLIHGSIYKQAQQRAGGTGYDFAPVYAHVADQIRSADIAVINQETVLAGKVLPVSDYPRFNSPTEVGDALTDIGFDVINHANNHILDKGEKGIKATLDYWDTKPVKVTGVYRNDEDLENIRIIEKKGIKTAYLGVTEMTNGLYLPKGSPYRIVYASDTELIQHLIEKAKSMADVVVVSVHWGEAENAGAADGRLGRGHHLRQPPPCRAAAHGADPLFRRREVPRHLCAGQFRVRAAVRQKHGERPFDRHHDEERRDGQNLVRLHGIHPHRDALRQQIFRYHHLPFERIYRRDGVAARREGVYPRFQPRVHPEHHRPEHPAEISGSVCGLTRAENIRRGGESPS